MKKILSMFFLIILATGVRAQETDTSMKEFTSEKGLFSVKMPGTPKETTESVKTKSGGTTVIHKFTVEVGEVAYIVSYNVYANRIDDISTALDNWRDGFITGVNGKLLKEQKLSLSDYQGRAIDVDSTDLVFLVDAYLVEDTLYQVLFGKPKNHETPANVDQFFRSFELLEP